MKNIDTVNNPKHYKQHMYETIEEMVILFGINNVITYCKICAYKYKARAPYKNNVEEDYAKADWYLSKVKELEYEL